MWPISSASVVSVGSQMSGPAAASTRRIFTIPGTCHKQEHTSTNMAQDKSEAVGHTPFKLHATPDMIDNICAFRRRYIQAGQVRGTPHTPASQRRDKIARKAVSILQTRVSIGESFPKKNTVGCVCFPVSHEYFYRVTRSRTTHISRATNHAQRTLLIAVRNYCTLKGRPAVTTRRSVGDSAISFACATSQHYSTWCSATRSARRTEKRERTTSIHEPEPTWARIF